MAKKTIRFEEALAKLERIADEIEQGKVGLEESISRYEEGMQLLKRCREILAAAEQRIIKLDPDVEGPASGAEDDPSSGSTG